MGPLVLLGVFLGLVVLRMPIAFALGIASFATAFVLDLPQPIQFICQQMAEGINSFSLLTIPFFILAGVIMSEGGIAVRLIDFANIFVGFIRGGLAMVNVVASMFFGGITGSSVADASSIGSVMIPMMEKEGYDRDYAVDVTITASTQGILVPPSHNAIIYCLAAGGGVSIGRVFLGGIIPGVFLGLMVMLIAYVIASRRNYPRGRRVSLPEAMRITREALLGLATPFIIVGGIISGKFTATESSAVAVVWALIVTLFIYRSLRIPDLARVFGQSVRTISTVMLLIATASAFGKMIALMDLPAIVMDAMLSVSQTPWVVLVMINIVLLFLGCIMDMAPTILIVTPVLLPLVTRIGIDPVHFGIMLLLNLAIGLLTPPVGSTLFVGCAIGNISIEKIVKSLLPFYLTLIIVLIFITYVPAITMFLPNLFFK
ncbi:MAG: TRAP transporter large permease [bacterium]